MGVEPCPGEWLAKDASNVEIDVAVEHDNVSLFLRLRHPSGRVGTVGVLLNSAVVVTQTAFEVRTAPSVFAWIVEPITKGSKECIDVDCTGDVVVPHMKAAGREVGGCPSTQAAMRSIELSH